MSPLRWTLTGAAVLPMLCLLVSCGGGPTSVRVGSKKFTESVVLGEMVAATVRAHGGRASHRRELGGTQILWRALVRGDIDVYPEYTGTIEREIFGGRISGRAAMRAALAKHGIVMGPPLGFNNTYALGMKKKQAKALGITRVSQLRDHPELRLGFTAEFLNRGDGWPGLKAHYGLPNAQVRGMDHDLAYRGLASGTLDVVDLYSTDADIQYYDLQVLEDDLRFFPEYQAVLLHRKQLPERVHLGLHQLASSLDEASMTALNARVKLHKEPEAQVAADFVSKLVGKPVAHDAESRLGRLLRHTLDHLLLVVISMLGAIGVAIPLGIAAARRQRLERIVLAVVGILQTIPSLALLVFMIPLLGIGAPPAIAALFLYGLLPIVRNTHAGIKGIARELLESADALGLPPDARMRLVELPLAMPSILAGIKTAAVINVGTATLGALIGAGGYGEPILTGIRLDDTWLILEGAVPAALLALLVEHGFNLLERRVVPAGLRLKPEEVAFNDPP